MGAGGREEMDRWTWESCIYVKKERERERERERARARERASERETLLMPLKCSTHRYASASQLHKASPPPASWRELVAS